MKMRGISYCLLILALYFVTGSKAFASVVHVDSNPATASVFSSDGPHNHSVGFLTGADGFIPSDSFLIPEHNPEAIKSFEPRTVKAVSYYFSKSGLSPPRLRS